MCPMLAGCVGAPRGIVVVDGNQTCVMWVRAPPKLLIPLVEKKQCAMLNDPWYDMDRSLLNLKRMKYLKGMKDNP